jgi:hypothetical protein
MNKKYNEFDEAAPNLDRLILHADPDTGELKKTTFRSAITFGMYCGIIRQYGDTPVFINKLFSSLGDFDIQNETPGYYEIIQEGAFVDGSFIAYLSPGRVLNLAFDEGVRFNVERLDDNVLSITTSPQEDFWIDQIALIILK